MIIWNALVLALRAIRRNPLRSSLTMLGIVIGIASVVIMVNLGRGATASVTAQIAALGTNMLSVRPGQMGAQRGGPARSFEMDDVQAIAREVAGLEAVAPAANRGVTAVFGNTNWATTVTGTDNGYLDVRDWGVSRGRTFSEAELLSGKAVCLLGATVSEKLFGTQDPVGSQVRLRRMSCEIIGVLASKGQSTMGSDQDDVILMPIRTFFRRIGGSRDVTVIFVSAREGLSTDEVREQIEDLMRRRRHISALEEDDFSVMDMKQLTQMLTGTTQVLTALLGAVAAVSLLVGGIGIMNIMLVSVTERTREIGIRLAVGALARDVLLQFLVESVVLSLFGGLFGLVLALGASSALADLLALPFVFSADVVIVASLFSAAVGIVFGYFPARTAARLNPIEALRHE